MATHSSTLAWRIPGTGAWWAAIYGVAQSRTRLTWLSNSSETHEVLILVQEKGKERLALVSGKGDWRAEKLILNVFARPVHKVYLQPFPLHSPPSIQYLFSAIPADPSVSILSGVFCLFLTPWLLFTKLALRKKELFLNWKSTQFACLMVVECWLCHLEHVSLFPWVSVFTGCKLIWYYQPH